MAARNRQTLSMAAASALAVVALAVGFGGGWLAHKAASTTTTTTTTSTSTSTTTTSSTTTTLAAVVRCTGASLSGSQVSSQGAAGTISVTYVVTNVTAKRCQMDGYPDIQLLSANMTDIQTTVERGQTAFSVSAANLPPSLITLVPNGRASFLLSYSDVPVGTETSCPQAASINVYPPASSTPLNIASSLGPCDFGTVDVSPFFLAS